MKKLLLTTLTITVLLSNLYAQNKYAEEEESDKSVSCGGVERWDVKVLTDSKANTIDFNPIYTTVSEMVNIATPKPSTSMLRYDGIEDKTYKLTCKITIKKSEADGDYHLVFSDGINTLIGEIPNPVCATASTSAYVDKYIAARNFIDSHIIYANTSNVNLPDVEVTGVGFIDFAHGQTGKAANNIELHPILDIHFATIMSANDLSKEKVLNVLLSPNPAHNTVTVNVVSITKILENCSLQLFDVHSNCVNTFPLPVSGKSSITETLNVQHLAAGVYIYKLLNNGKPIYDGKLVIN
jgi:hypothetical protein